MKKYLSCLLCILLVFSMLVLSGCSRSPEKTTQETSTPNNAETAVTPTAQVPEDDKAIDVTIAESPAVRLSRSMTNYTDPNGNFTARIPDGWLVSTAGYDMYYWIRFYDPSEPNLQVFTLLKTEALLMDQNSKNFYVDLSGYDLYRMMADMIVVEHVEDLYTQFMDFCAFCAVYEPSYQGFEYPQISDFQVVEKHNYGSPMAGFALDDALLHAVYTNTLSQSKGEGMFTGTLCNGFISNGVGCNMMYNINGITAPYGQLAEYEDLLTDIFASIQYTDAFVSTVMIDQQIKTAGAAALNQSLTETSDIITSGWNARQKSYDVTSAKYSDAIRGYETVYDVESGDVYKAYIGFTDTPGVEQYYLPATDDMYSLPISGYIEN